MSAPAAQAPAAAEPAAAAEAPVAAPPKVVTRTRGRAASAPQTGSETGAGTASEAAPGTAGDGEDDDVAHVPVKKGARKR